VLESSVSVETAGPPEKNKHGQRLSAQRAGWYILRCGAGLEFLAEQSLRDSGWEIFLPRETKWRPSRWRLRPRQGEHAYPRFPGYLLLATTPPLWPDWNAWPVSRFIRGVLSMAGEPVPLARGEIERLRAEDGLAVPHVSSVPVHRAFAAGDQVHVMAGAFRGFAATLDSIDEAGAHITVQLFGRPAEVPLPLTWLEAA
jgi:transcription antitermination factor NusG